MIFSYNYDLETVFIIEYRLKPYLFLGLERIRVLIGHKKTSIFHVLED